MAADGIIHNIRAQNLRKCFAIHQLITHLLRPKTRCVLLRLLRRKVNGKVYATANEIPFDRLKKEGLSPLSRKYIIDKIKLSLTGCKNFLVQHKNSVCPLFILCTEQPAPQGGIVHEEENQSNQASRPQ